MSDSRGTCVRISLDAIALNTQKLKAAVGGVRLMAVVKANAYGHGSVMTAKTALKNGADCLGVAIPEEGRALREKGIAAPILVLGSVTEAGADIAVAYGLVQTVYTPENVYCLQKACVQQRRSIDVHLKLDTGMNRIGARDESEVKAVLNALQEAENVHLTGVFTHFADAENADEAFSRAQFDRFEKLCALLPDGLLRHAAASEASLRFPWARLDMVREGIALYGCPGGENMLGLAPAMRFETRVAYVKTLHAGDTVGYGRTFKAEREMRAATLPVGYGDGYPRACSGKAKVLIGGVMCPVLGNVCMDQMMVDVSRAGEVRAGDMAVLMGSQGNEMITAGMLADWAGTISYEILLSPHARVPVIYEADGKVFDAEE